MSSRIFLWFRNSEFESMAQTKKAKDLAVESQKTPNDTNWPQELEQAINNISPDFDQCVKLTKHYFATGQPLPKFHTTKRKRSGGYTTEIKGQNNAFCSFIPYPTIRKSQNETARIFLRYISAKSEDEAKGIEHLFVRPLKKS